VLLILPANGRWDLTSHLEGYAVNYCITLKSGVNFQVALKQNFATIRPASMQKYGFVISPSAFVFSTL
jgi:hypothetical protein